MNVGETVAHLRGKSGAPAGMYEVADRYGAPAIRTDPAALTRPPVVESHAQAVELFWTMFRGGVQSVDHYHEAHVWLAYLDALGFAGLDGAARPASPLVLYRAAPESKRDGLSWTSRYDVAGAFVESVWHDTPSRVWGAIVEPWQILAAADDIPEYLVDTRGLRIYPA